MKFLEELEKMDKLKQVSVFGGMMVTLALVCALMGCRPWKILAMKLKRGFDVNLSVDYVGTHSDGSEYTVPLLDAEKVEEKIL